MQPELQKRLDKLVDNFTQTINDFATERVMVAKEAFEKKFPY